MGINQAQVEVDTTKLKVVAGKPFTMQGKSYRRGDPVDLEGLDRFKVGQLLSQRYLIPDNLTDPATLPQGADSDT